MINPLSAIRSHFASVGPRNLAGQRNLLPFEGTAGESETLHIKILRFFWLDPRNELLDATCRIEAKASAIQCFIRGNGGTLKMVPFIINAMYTLDSGYLYVFIGYTPAFSLWLLHQWSCHTTQQTIGMTRWLHLNDVCNSTRRRGLPKQERNVWNITGRIHAHLRKPMKF